jgi:type IV secretory pathway TrbD component
MNKALIESYLSNLLGVVLALVTTTMINAGVASPFDFGLGEWLGIANGLWAAGIPTVIRYLNKKDPAFGKVAEMVSDEVTRRLEDAAEEAKKATKKPVTKAPTKAVGSTTTKKPPASKK